MLELVLGVLNLLSQYSHSLSACSLMRRSILCFIKKCTGSSINMKTIFSQTGGKFATRDLTTILVTWVLLSPNANTQVPPTVSAPAASPFDPLMVPANTSRCGGSATTTLTPAPCQKGIKSPGLIFWSSGIILSEL